MRKYFTSESVCSGHPDKICDRISDSIVDEVLQTDPQGRVAVETLVTKNKVVIAGEVTTKAKIDYQEVAREQIRSLGYTQPELGFSDQSPIETYIHTQSPEIATGVDSDGAGDQGMMFGFACQQTPELMPLPIMLAHKLARAIDSARENKVIPYLRPDGKTQVTIEFDGDRPVSLASLVLAVPHEERVGLSEVIHDLFEKVVVPVIAEYNLDFKEKDLIVNGTGVWHVGGPASDTGVTGRKIIVDTYGGYSRVGGGCFSGKDPTKVDRSGAYAARYLAKNIVAAGLAEKVEVLLAYCIGQAKPVMTDVETFGTGKVKEQEIKEFMNDLLDISVKGILAGLNLRRPIYQQTSAYGHFGWDGLAWERVV